MVYDIHIQMYVDCTQKLKRTKVNHMKRIFTFFLALVMLIGMLPMQAFATETEFTDTYENDARIESKEGEEVAEKKEPTPINETKPLWMKKQKN